jgi:hypothetical protein
MHILSGVRRCVELIIASFLGNCSKAKNLGFKYSIEFCYFKRTKIDIYFFSLSFTISPRKLRKHKSTFRKCYAVLKFLFYDRNPTTSYE